MPRVIRWKPVQQPNSFDHAFERFFDDNWRNLFNENAENRETTYKLALDVVETDMGYNIVANLPGVDAESIDIRVEEDVLNIEAEIAASVVEVEDARNLLQERRTGKFARSVRLPQPVDVDKIDATYNNGVLELSLPKLPEAQPKQIKVKVAE